MQFFEHKGYVIYPTPHLLVGSGYWRIELAIRYDNVVEKYSSDNVFLTKGEAVFHAIQLGKKLIDDGLVLRG
jgi:hypothetical protein